MIVEVVTASSSCVTVRGIHKAMGEESQTASPTRNIDATASLPENHLVPDNSASRVISPMQVMGSPSLAYVIARQHVG